MAHCFVNSCDARSVYFMYNLPALLAVASQCTHQEQNHKEVRYKRAVTYLPNFLQRVLTFLCHQVYLRAGFSYIVNL